MVNKESNGFGIASLVTSIIGLVGFIMPYLAIVPSILAIIFASIQKKTHQVVWQQQD